MPSAEGSFKVWIYLGFIVGLTRSSRPRFDTSTDMRKVLIPPDADVDSVIFRLRATDEEPDFPLIFNVSAKLIPVVRIENLPCTLYNKVCQANVILTRRLSPGKFYDFVVVVRDSKGENNSMQATISVTNGTTPLSKIFLHKPSLIMVPEDAKPGTELDYLIVQSSPWGNKPVYIELWQPKDLFKIIQHQTEKQTEGIITLIGELDFETQSMHTLTMYATDPYTEVNYDTRNIVGLQIVVIVQDVQDVPPIFTLAPPLTKINNTVQLGDIILRVHAEDGDKGVPREVTYGLVSEFNPFTTYFNINESSGEISLARPLEELAQITRVGAPILLSVVAEEIRHSWDEPPAQATVVEIGILIGEPENSPPYFETDKYVCYIEENADPGTSVKFANPNKTVVKDDDVGKTGVFTLQLVNNNGTFEILPSVAERSANFVVSVRDNMLLDYEKYESLSFNIFAQEVGPTTNLSANAHVTVFLIDVNDNPPEFDESTYEVMLSENATVGTRVVQVHATDKDTGIFAKIRYTKILGLGSEAFDINSDSGWITVTGKTDALDRERAEKLELFVEARDEDGKGLSSKVKLIVHLLDVNDNAPVFEKELYEFRLNAEMNNFTAPAIVKAIDADSEPPNNEVRYEIMQGNYENKFKLDEISGELFVQEQIRKTRHARESDSREHRFLDAELSGNGKHLIMTKSIEHLKNESESGMNLISQRMKRADENPLFTLTIRAYDLGVPLMSSVVRVHILRGFTPGARIVTFVMPGEQLDPYKAAETLATITGGRVTIQEIRPYIDNQSDQSDLTETNNKRSVIVARVEQSNSGTLVDIEKIRKNLAANGVGIISGMDGMQPGDSKTDSTKTHISNVTHLLNEDVTVYKAENKILIWLLIIFGLLLLLSILTVILCCICPGCPFYMEPRKRRIHSSETLIIHSDGKQKKHVQRSHMKTINGLWTDRKQAWSADRDRKNWQFNKRNMTAELSPSSLPGDTTAVVDVAPLVHTETIRVHKEQDKLKRRPDDKIFVEDIEAQAENATFDIDSIRRHELDRGSDVIQKSYQNANDQQLDNYEEEIREQHYYRDGNAEVLRLVTRGHVEAETSKRQIEQHTHPYNGKDILLQRFIEDQKLRKEQDGEMSTVDAHKESTQPEIILIPGSLDQRHMEHLRFDIQQLIMDRNESRMKPPYQMEAVPTIEVTRAIDKSLSESNEKIIQQYDVELVRQNTLLTRLLLERETRVAGGLTTDVASYLETQSLPGQVAIATQTDRTTATQTDYRLRSRSDNESEDEFKFKRKFKFKKRCIEEECPRKSAWMKSPLTERGRTYIGIKMARRKMAEIGVGRRAISPIVLQEISESLNRHDHFSSTIDDDEDEHLFQYCQNPIKSTKIEVCKETIEISTSSQEEMEHRLVKMSQRRNINDPKVIPVEPSFRVLEVDSTPTKIIRKVTDKKSPKESVEIKKIIPQKKFPRGSRELKVKELKSTVDATISRILGSEKKSKNVVKPLESEFKVRRPLKHQAALKADSGSSELDDADTRRQINIPHVASKEYKTSPVNSKLVLKKVSTVADLSNTESKKSPSRSKSTSPIKKPRSSKIAILPFEIKSPSNETHKHSSRTKLTKVKSTDITKEDIKTGNVSDSDVIKSKRKSHKDEFTKSLTVSVMKPESAVFKDGLSNQPSFIEEREKSEIHMTKVESTPKNVSKVDTQGEVDPVNSQTDANQKTNASLPKEENGDKENIVCIMEKEKAITKDQRQISELAETRDESSVETGDNDSYKEVSYTRLDNEVETTKTVPDVKESSGTTEVKKTDTTEEVRYEKPVFQKQKRITQSTDETLNFVDNGSPAKLKKQFTDDFTKVVEKMKIDEIDDKIEICKNELVGSKKQEDGTSIGKTISEKSSEGEKLKTSEVLDLKSDQDLCVAVNDGNQIGGREKLEKVSGKSPKLERSNKIMSDSITLPGLNVDYDSESSDESDLSCKTMLNRHSLERKTFEEEEQTAVTESRNVIGKVTCTDTKLTTVDETRTTCISKSEIQETEIIVDEANKADSATNNEKVEQFTEDKRRPINSREKKHQNTEKPLKTSRSVQDVVESKEKGTKSAVTKKAQQVKEQEKSKLQSETSESNKRNKSTREDDKNMSRNTRPERRKKMIAIDMDTEKKTEKSPYQTRGPEARSRYMAWYKQKREEMERKRLERKLAEEEEMRPRWARRAKTKSEAETPETTPQSRRKVKPLINVESEQLKAIVRQGRKLRRGRVEDPSVQIFVPERPPPQPSSTPRHHLVQHSEYKFEREPPPFYLHPPPAPHPSPEHFPDCPMRECVDDDIDSGIAVSLTGTTKLRHQQLLEKKSVFDIAYSEASPTKLCTDSSTPPPS